MSPATPTPVETFTSIGADLIGNGQSVILCDETTEPDSRMYRVLQQEL